MGRCRQVFAPTPTIICLAPPWSTEWWRRQSRELFASVHGYSRTTNGRVGIPLGASLHFFVSPRTHRITDEASLVDGYRCHRCDDVVFLMCVTV